MAEAGVLPKEPADEEFYLSLRNGLILCNVPNKVNPGAVYKVVESLVLDVQATEGAAQSAIQNFENMRNFLVAVGKMLLLTFLNRLILKSYKAAPWEKEDEQVKQALNVWQGGIRKSKPENKVRTKHQFPATYQKSDIIETLNDTDNGKILEFKRTNFSNPGSEPVQLLVCGTTRVHKLQRSFSRNSRHPEPRKHLNSMDSRKSR
ncbi:kinesin KIN-14F [Olea europaea subsp. europaea]|uniref:Kinesin KIN-14F n=1 Tax=Olea europaea subsp. europaea TaxID=158383 RepID=A0A8S0RHT5_OLEEU|nr:kinesin KIN-14F [Olea europaea subsp. europaea]